MVESNWWVASQRQSLTHQIDTKFWIWNNIKPQYLSETYAKWTGGDALIVTIRMWSASNVDQLSILSVLKSTREWVSSGARCQHGVVICIYIAKWECVKSTSKNVDCCMYYWWHAAERFYSDEYFRKLAKTSSKHCNGLNPKINCLTSLYEVIDSDKIFWSLLFLDDVFVWVFGLVFG